MVRTRSSGPARPPSKLPGRGRRGQQPVKLTYKDKLAYVLIVGRSSVIYNPWTYGELVNEVAKHAKELCQPVGRQASRWIKHVTDQWRLRGYVQDVDEDTYTFSEKFIDRAKGILLNFAISQGQISSLNPRGKAALIKGVSNEIVESEEEFIKRLRSQIKDLSNENETLRKKSIQNTSDGQTQTQEDTMEVDQMPIPPPLRTAGSFCSSVPYDYPTPASSDGEPNAESPAAELNASPSPHSTRWLQFSDEGSVLDDGAADDTLQDELTLVPEDNNIVIPDLDKQGSTSKEPFDLVMRLSLLKDGLSQLGSKEDMELSRLRKENEVLHDENQLLESEVKECDMIAEYLFEHYYQPLQAENEQLRAEKKQIIDERDSLSTKYEQLADVNDRLEQEVQNLTSEKGTLIKQIELLQTGLNGLRSLGSVFMSQSTNIFTSLGIS